MFYDAMTLKSSQEGRLKFLVRIPITSAISLFFIVFLTLRTKKSPAEFSVALPWPRALASLSALLAFPAFQIPRSAQIPTNDPGLRPLFSATNKIIHSAVDFCRSHSTFE